MTAYESETASCVKAFCSNSMYVNHVHFSDGWDWYLFKKIILFLLNEVLLTDINRESLQLCKPLYREVKKTLLTIIRIGS